MPQEMPENPASPYKGRFAPSPTGPLHFGSLIAAVASYLQARVSKGEWLVRIEDIDPHREVSGAAELILRSLDAHGFQYGPPLLQSSRVDIYSEITQDLIESGYAYPCSCSRKVIQATAPTGRAGHIYPGTCRPQTDADRRAVASVRVRTNDELLGFQDLLQGNQSCRLESEIGDFLIRRGDGLVAYQLAAAVDDYYQGITEVVRGTDLLDSTFMQLWLQQLLHYVSPTYLHTPIVLDGSGKKLSKQSGASAIDSDDPVTNIFHVLVFLGQNPDPKLLRGTLADIWQWAEQNWDTAPLMGLQKKSYQSMILQ